MEPSEAQVRALEALGRHYVSDDQILEMLAALFATTPSASVQAAIAGIMLRADLPTTSSPTLVQHLLANRLPAAVGDNTIDALLRRLEAH